MHISNLSFLVANDLLQSYQSAYRKQHSTETAMLRVWSDILTAADTRQVTLLGLLDLSAAFDCVDHDLKLVCLVHQSLAEQTPSYLASNIQLTTNTGRPQLQSASERICVVSRTHNHLWRQKFFCCWSSCVECLAIISATGHEL